jgi:hypothetical protein
MIMAAWIIINHSTDFLTRACTLASSTATVTDMNMRAIPQNSQQRAPRQKAGLQ